MVRGIDLFASHFKGYEDQYVLIGGTAAYLALEEAELTPRATKDLDIVLCLEVLDPRFVIAFWQFVDAGGYERRERSDGKRIFYRFQKPANPQFPAMLELFSRQPDALKVADSQKLVPIRAGAESGSLSAILLDSDYYEFLRGRQKMIQGVPVVDPLGLIALKAYAWLDLTARRDAGENVDSRNINKHRGDVFRLYQLISPDERVTAPVQVRDNVGRFLDRVDPALELKPFGITGTKLPDVIQALKSVYGVV